MQNLINSFTRTYSPIIIGALVTWLITLGIELDLETQAGLVIALTGVIQAVYYAIVRLIEEKHPKIGVLLGKAITPEYKK